MSNDRSFFELVDEYVLPRLSKHGFAILSRLGPVEFGNCCVTLTNDQLALSVYTDRGSVGLGVGPCWSLADDGCASGFAVETFVAFLTVKGNSSGSTIGRRDCDSLKVPADLDVQAIDLVKQVLVFENYQREVLDLLCGDREQVRKRMEEIDQFVIKRDEDTLSMLSKKR